MQNLSEAGKQKVSELAQRYGVSTDAVMAMLQALVHGNGMMAQFNHPELGGSGQWMRGGMIMVGDMFNNSLKAKIDGLCTELSQLLAQQPVVLHPGASQSQFQSGGGQQQQQGGHGIFGQAGTSPEVSLFIPGGQGVSGNWWPGDLGSPAQPVLKTTFATPTFPRRGGWLCRFTGT